MRNLNVMSVLVTITCIALMNKASAQDLICDHSKIITLVPPNNAPQGENEGAIDYLNRVMGSSGYADNGTNAYCKGDYNTAAREWQNLAKVGNADAEANLGFLFNWGRGLPQNFSKAERLYREAVRKGNTVAQYYLGNMYANGQGVAQDYVEAYLWLNLAAANGVKGSDAARDAVASKLNTAEISEAQRRAQECFDTNYSSCE